MHQRTVAKRALTAIAVAASFTLLAACSGPSDTPTTEPDAGGGGGESVVLRLALPHPDSAYETEVAKEVAERVLERTEGRVDIQVFPSGGSAPTPTWSTGRPRHDIVAFIDASAAAGGRRGLGILAAPTSSSNQQAEKFATSDLYQQWMDDFENNSGLKMLALNWWDTPRGIMGTGLAAPGRLNGVSCAAPLAAWLDTSSRSARP